MLGLDKTQHLPDIDMCRGERRIAFGRDVIQTLVKHTSYHSVHIVHHETGHGVTQFSWQWIIGKIKAHYRHRNLGIRANRHLAALEVGNREIASFRRIGRHGYRGENLLDFSLDYVRVDISHHYDTLLVRTIPPVIVVAQFVGLEVQHNIHCADGQTTAITAAVREHLGQHLLIRTHDADVRATPFLLYHTALFIDVLVGEGQVA